MVRNVEQSNRTNGRAQMPASPSGPQLERPAPAAGHGPASPWAVLAAALAVGYVFAKAIDWRSHAHPRR